MGVYAFFWKIYYHGNRRNEINLGLFLAAPLAILNNPKRFKTSNTVIAMLRISNKYYIIIIGIFTSVWMTEGRASYLIAVCYLIV